MHDIYFKGTQSKDYATMGLIKRIALGIKQGNVTPQSGYQFLSAKFNLQPGRDYMHRKILKMNLSVEVMTFNDICDELSEFYIASRY